MPPSARNLQLEADRRSRLYSYAELAARYGISHQRITQITGPLRDLTAEYADRAHKRAQDQQSHHPAGMLAEIPAQPDFQEGRGEEERQDRRGPDEDHGQLGAA